MSVRVGIIGTGFARRVQLPALRLISDVTVTAVASGRRANAEAAAKEFAIPRVYEDGIELSRSPEVDLVLVSSTPDTHARYVIAALEAGKHVLCEKPMALNAGEAERMLAVAEGSAGRVAWVDHELRYEPNRRKVRDLILRGGIGEVRHIEMLLKPYVRSDGRPQTAAAPWSWWFDATRGGGLLNAVGSHLIDLCRFWTGSEAALVAGGVATFVTERQDEAGVVRPVTADEYASFTLSLANGVAATVTLTGVAHHGPGHFTQVTGTDGTLVLTGETKLELGKLAGPLEDVSAADDLGERVTPNNMWTRSFVRLMRDLVRAVQGRGPEGTPASFRDGVAVQRVLDVVRAGGGKLTPLD